MKNYFKKIRNALLITCYEAKKTEIFCSAKDSIAILQKANVIYRVTCLSCNEDYVRKTDLNLVTRLNEYASRENQLMY